MEAVMSATRIAVVQTPWDCKFTRYGYRLSGVRETDQPESIWMCVRDGERRPVTEDDCEDCPHWEMDDFTPCP
jgi:hypothetical protein